MTKLKQLDKNMKLTVKLANYIAKHSKDPEVKKLSGISGVSIVPFSATDKELNDENEKIIPGLIEEGKKVIKAEETKNSKTPWRFEQVSV